MSALAVAAAATTTRRTGNNMVSASLDRVEQVRTQTLEWLKSFEKLIHTTPSSGASSASIVHHFSADDVVECNDGGGDDDGTVVIETPLDTAPLWSRPRRRRDGGGGDGGHHHHRRRRRDVALFACSFCGSPVGMLSTHTVVSFNAMLPQPYVVQCFKCCSLFSPTA